VSVVGQEQEEPSLYYSNMSTTPAQHYRMLPSSSSSSSWLPPTRMMIEQSRRNPPQFMFLSDYIIANWNSGLSSDHRPFVVSPQSSLMLSPRSFSMAHEIARATLSRRPLTQYKESQPQASASKRGTEEDESSLTSMSFTTSASSANEPPTKIRPYQSGHWMERYAELVDFKRQYGHCLVPNTFIDNPPLAEWVKRQRYQYKLRNLGEHNSMTQERIEKLERLGFVWNSHDQMWEERLKDVKLYIEINGDCNVPNRYPPDPSLAVWVKVSNPQIRMWSYC